MSFAKIPLGVEKNLLNMVSILLFSWMVFVCFVPWLSYQVFSLPTLAKLNPLTPIKHPA